MPINQASKPVCCISCGKLIAKGYIDAGSIEIRCKCGVVNKLEAEHKPEGRSELSKRVSQVVHIPYGVQDQFGNVLMPGCFSKKTGR